VACFANAHVDGVTVFVSTDTRLIDMADRIITMEDGRILRDTHPTASTLATLAVVRQ